MYLLFSAGGLLLAYTHQDSLSCRGCVIHISFTGPCDNIDFEEVAYEVGMTCLEFGKLALV